MPKSLTDLNDRHLDCTDALCSLGLFLITVLSRIPFRSQILYHWDSVNFANGMRQFDVLQEHPQPPGYIVYVWLCRLVDLLFHNANTTMVWISIVASGMAVMALYLLGRAMWNRRVGLVAALFLASNPLFWFYGEIALPHTLDTWLVLLSLWLLYRVRQGEERILWPVVVALGIAGGVRQQTLVFLLPVALYAVWRLGWKRILLAGLLGTVVCLAWFVPLMVSCGGIGNYLDEMSTFGARFQRSTSVLMGAAWSGVAYNLRKLGIYTLYGWCAGLIPAIWYSVAQLWHRPRLQSWGRSGFLALWVGPVLCFYIFIHMGQQGLIFVFLPAFLLISAVVSERLLMKWENKGYWPAVAGTLLVLIQAGTFLAMPEYPLGANSQRLLTRATLVNSDRYYEDRFTTIHEHFPPESSAILAANWDHVRYYMPEYVTLSFSGANEWSRGSADGESVVTPGELGLQPDSQGQVVFILFDDKLASLNESAALTRKVGLQHGGTLEYLALVPNMVFRFGMRSFGAAEP